MTSAIAAMVRAQAEKNGHNIDVVQAMIDKTKKLEIDGEVLNKEGNILTLTDRQAAKEYGNPRKPLLSSGTVESLDEVLDKLGCAGAERHYIQPTGVEKIATWIELISPVLLIIGVIGIYIEFKTPGFGLPGIIALIAFSIYFLGGYVAGLSGMEWLVFFILGLALIAVELFVFPGTIVLGVIGACLMLVALVMALVDVYPSPVPGLPSLPGLPQLELPLRTLGIASLGSVVAILVLARFLPKTPFYQALVSQSASGVISVAEVEQRHAALIGQVGVAISALRPGGKAQFGDRVLDVMSQGDLVPKGTKVQIVGYSGREAIVEAVG
jgi:membrane-bound serine protease (ClpP class)